MRPAIAVAATVYGEARYVADVAAPMRPLKLRDVVEMPTFSPPRAAGPRPMQAPQPLGYISAPASSSAASVPSPVAVSAVLTDAGATNRGTAVLRPCRISAAILRSSSLAPVQAPI